MAENLRFDGTLKSWHDHAGYGLIAPSLGGQDIYVHITALPSGARPKRGLRLSFEIEFKANGEKCASRVEVLTVRSDHGRHPAPWGAPSVLAIPLLIFVYAVMAVTWRVWHGFAVLYAVLSIICLIAYAIDKNAAVSGKWRISEKTLLNLGLLGGWPGAILAQQWFRHKSSKQSFRQAFWATVILNLVAFVTFHSPLAERLRAVTVGPL